MASGQTRSAKWHRHIASGFRVAPERKGAAAPISTGSGGFWQTVSMPPVKGAQGGKQNIQSAQSIARLAPRNISRETLPRLRLCRSSSSPDNHLGMLRCLHAMEANMITAQKSLLGYEDGRPADICIIEDDREKTHFVSWSDLARCIPRNIPSCRVGTSGRGDKAPNCQQVE